MLKEINQIQPYELDHLKMLVNDRLAILSGDNSDYINTSELTRVNGLIISYATKLFNLIKE